jgi:glutaminyl-tRNA synthetase
MRFHAGHVEVPQNLTALTARFDVADRRDHRSEAPVFNRSVGLRDTWSGKQ